MYVRIVSFTLLALFASVGVANAGTIHQTDLDGRDATVTWTFLEDDSGDYCLQLVIENDTVNPRNVTDTVTGFSFSVLGGASLDTVLSSDGRLIDIDTLGLWSDEDGNSDEDSADNWGIGDGSDYAAVDNDVANLVHFTAGASTTAKHAIIGPGDDDDDYLDFATANGSIKGNPGHNPFVMETLTMKLSLSNVTAGTLVGDLSLGDGIIYFGTGLEVNVVPLPAGAWMGLALLGGIGAVQVVRRRRRLNAI